MSKVKYMGASDFVKLDEGENWGGRLAEPLEKEVLFSKDSGHLVDTEEAGLSEEAVELLLEDETRFKDVTGLKRIPANAYEKMFGGVVEKAAPNLVGEAPEVIDADADADDDGGAADADVKGEQGSSATSAPAGGGAAATTGGSTSTPPPAGTRP